jgi:3-oxoadipate enol-lactonase
MRLAIDVPELVASLGIIDSVSELDALVEHFVMSWIDLAETRNPELFYAGVLPSLYSRGFLASHREMLSQRAEKMKQLPAEYFRGQVELYRAFLNDVTMTDELPRISAPSLVACGEEDILKPPRFSRIIAGAIPGAELVFIPGAGHVAVFEAQETLQTLILGFLERTSA